MVKLGQNLDLLPNRSDLIGVGQLQSIESLDRIFLAGRPVGC